MIVRASRLPIPLAAVVIAGSLLLFAFPSIIACANDGTVSLGVKARGNSVEPLAIRVDPRCIISSSDSEAGYQVPIIDVLCATNESGPVGVRKASVQIFGLKPGGILPARKKWTDADFADLEAGEQALNDVPVIGYLSLSRQMANPGFYFQRQGEDYYATHEIAEEKQGDTPLRSLDCISEWTRPTGKGEFTYANSRCTAFLNYEGIELFAIFELDRVVQKEALLTLLDRVCARIRAP